MVRVQHDLPFIKFELSLLPANGIYAMNIISIFKSLL